MRRARKLLSILVVCALVEAATATAALAYVIRGTRWPADVPCSGAECLGQPFTLTYSYSNMFDGGIKMPDGNPLPNDIIKESIEEALGLWANAIPVHFIEVPGNSPANFYFRHIYYNGPDPPPPAPPTTKANSTCLGYGAGCRVDFDHGDPWQVVGTTSAPDILGVTIHEVGHILGLDHSTDPNANMYPIARRMSGPGTGFIYTDDLDGIHALYGFGTGSLSPIGVPEPASCLAVFTLGVWPLLVRRTRSPQGRPPLACPERSRRAA